MHYKQFNHLKDNSAYGITKKTIIEIDNFIFNYPKDHIIGVHQIIDNIGISNVAARMVLCFCHSAKILKGFLSFTCECDRVNIRWEFDEDIPLSITCPYCNKIINVIDSLKILYKKL